MSDNDDNDDKDMPDSIIQIREAQKTISKAIDTFVKQTRKFATEGDERDGMLGTMMLGMFGLMLQGKLERIGQLIDDAKEQMEGKK